MTSIGVQAFYGCEELTSIYIPRSVNFVGDNAFNECDKLSKIYIYAESNIAESLTDLLENFTKDEQTLQSVLYHKYVKNAE